MNQILRTDLISGNILYIHRFMENTNEIIEVFVLLPNSATVSSKQFDYEQANAIMRQFTSELENSLVLGELFKAEHSETNTVIDINNRKHYMIVGEEKFKISALLDIARSNLEKERNSKEAQYGIMAMKNA